MKLTSAQKRYFRSLTENTTPGFEFLAKFPMRISKKNLRGQKTPTGLHKDTDYMYNIAKYIEVSSFVQDKSNKIN